MTCYCSILLFILVVLLFIKLWHTDIILTVTKQQNYGFLFMPVKGDGNFNCIAKTVLVEVFDSNERRVESGIERGMMVMWGGVGGQWGWNYYK